MEPSAIPSPSSSRVPKWPLVLILGMGLGFFIHEVPALKFQSYALNRFHRIYGQEQVIGVNQSPPQQLADDIEFKRFWELWNILKDKYYQQPVKDRDLFYGAMAGLAQSLGDPYTAYFEPKTAEEFQESLAGKFEGIGAEIGSKDDVLQIIAPLPETPAERAGILAGDILIKINGEDTVGMSIEKAVSLIRGPKGTKVTLNVLRPSQKKPPFDVTITRDVIHIKSVRAKMLEDRIGYIELTSFNGDTSAAFQSAVRDLLRQDPKGLILDLRNDPGGFLDTAIDVASLWIGEQPIVKERRQGKIIQEFTGTRAASLGSMPTIVLVNQGSASASEIVAGALQDYGKAKLVGVKTFGKGSVQDYQSLSDGSAVKITIAEWLTPRERAINKTGLTPDVIVERTAEDYEAKRDPQLDRARELLTGKQISTPTATSTKP